MRNHGRMHSHCATVLRNFAINQVTHQNILQRAPSILTVKI